MSIQCVPCAAQRSHMLTSLECQQALSKRIHYGKFVAEAKFLARTEEYSRLIRSGDVEGIMRLLTDSRVEALVRTGALTHCAQ